MHALALLSSVVAVLAGVLVPVLVVLHGTTVGNAGRRNQLLQWLLTAAMLAVVSVFGAVQLRGRLLAPELDEAGPPVDESEWFLD